MENQQNNGENNAPKRSVTETGHAINLSNFLLLLKMVQKLEGQYMPSNPSLELNALEALYQSAKAEMNGCIVAETALDNATGARSEAFDRMKNISGKVHRNFKASNAPETAKANAQTIMNKLRGSVSPLKKKDIADGNEETQNHTSNSQRSYTQLVEHFRKLRELLETQPDFNPNEPELSKSALGNILDSIDDANNTVGNAVTDWRSVRRKRNNVFYAPQQGLVDTALKVKEYIASLFGTTSPEFKEINKIRFRNIKD